MSIGVICFVAGTLTGGFLLSKGITNPKDSSQTANTAAPVTKQPRFGQDWGSIKPHSDHPKSLVLTARMNQ